MAYNFLRDKDTQVMHSDILWTTLWQLNVLPKVKVFLWKLLWQRLPTTALLSTISRVPPSPCKICGEDDDELSHIFFKCSFARRYWSFVQTKLGYRFKFFDEWHAGCWLKEGDQLERPSKHHLLSFIGSSLWGLWTNRNEAIFNNHCYAIKVIYCRTLETVLELRNAQTPLANHGQNQSAEDYTIASNHDATNATITCDASWSAHQDKAGIGFLIRLPAGQIEEAMLTVHASSAFEGELHAIMLGLQKARALGLQDITITSDCLAAIKVLRKDFRIPWRQNTLVHDIWRMTSCFNHIR